MPGERTEQQKRQVRDAQMCRARLRRGAMLERLQKRLSQGNEAKGKGKGPPNVSMAAGAHMLAPVAVMFHDAVVDMYLWWTSHLSRFHFSQGVRASVCVLRQCFALKRKMRGGTGTHLSEKRRCSSAHGPGLLSDWLCPPEGPEDLPDDTFP